MKINSAVKLFLSLTLLIAARATSAAPTAAVQKAQTGEKENKLTAVMIEQVLNRISKSRCDFQFEGAVENDKPFNLSFLDLGCLVQMNGDIKVEILGDEKSQSAEKLNLDVLIKSKGLTVYFRALKEQTKGRFNVRFYSKYDTQTQIGKEKHLEATLASSINTDLITVKLQSIEINTTEDAKNPNLMTVDGTCKTEKTMLNFENGKLENIPATCFVRGTFEIGKGYKLKVGYRNSNTANTNGTARVP